VRYQAYAENRDIWLIPPWDPSRCNTFAKRIAWTLAHLCPHNRESWSELTMSSGEALAPGSVEIGLIAGSRVTFPSALVDAICEHLGYVLF
jgi:hypothetical protein